MGGKGAGNHLAASDVIVIGDSAVSSGTTAAPISDLNAQYSVVIGSQSGKNLNDWTSSETGPCVLIGGNSYVNMQRIGDSVVIGCNIFPNPSEAGFGGPVQMWGNCLVGNLILSKVSAGQNGSISRNVFVGEGCAQGVANNPCTPVQNVIIGYAACNVSPMNQNGFNNNVLIGAFAAQNLNANDCIAIGFSCGGAKTTGDNCILIGPSIQAGTCVGAIAIGVNCTPGNSAVNGASIGNETSYNARNCLILGDYSDYINRVATLTMQSQRSIWLGGGAGAGDGSATSTGSPDTFLCETNDGLTKRTLMYGNLATGNLLIGGSSPGVNRDFGANTSTNVLKLLNGTSGAPTNPVGGGYFYVLAGALHWVGSSGTDTTIAVA